MDKEYQILNHLKEEEQTSQRRIAAVTGMSLGTVNILLKKMLKKGLVKIERLDARSLRYILTPRGVMEKSKLTLNYITSAYRNISHLRQTFVQILQEELEEGSLLFLYGPQDEVLAVLLDALSQMRLSYTHVKRGEKLPQGAEKGLILVWDLEDEQELEGKGAINILERL